MFFRPDRVRGSVPNDNPGDHPSPELEEIDHPSSAAFDAQDPVGGKARASAVAGALGREHPSSWQRTTNRVDAGGRESRSRPPRPQSQSRPVAGESASRRLDNKVDGGAGVDRVFAEGDAGGRSRTYSGSSFDANRWDPAINTIEREISELSERLDPSRGGKRLRLRSSRVSARVSAFGKLEWICATPAEARRLRGALFLAPREARTHQK